MRIIAFLIVLSTLFCEEIEVNNRILAKMNGKSISLVDIKKDMDLYLERVSPETLSSTQMRFQFYEANWKDFLNQIIERELLLMEGEDLKAEISEADLKQEITKRFGEHLSNYLKARGISMDELKGEISKEIICNNLMWMHVWSRALQMVTPELIKTSYKEFSNKHMDDDVWTYRIVTLSGPEDKLGEIAQEAYLAVKGAQTTEEPILRSLIDSANLDQEATVSLSGELVIKTKDLSPEYVSILSDLSPNTPSRPMCRLIKNSEPVYKIFILKDHKESETPSFDAISEQIRGALVNQKAAVRRHKYINSLKKKFCLDYLDAQKLASPSFKPFRLT